MDISELTDAMRIGSFNPLNKRSDSDLGRFGLGLKTASFSQCRVLTVISKKACNDIVAMRWNLDKVQETNRWEVDVLESAQINDIYKSNLLGEQGTLIVWTKVDRIVEDAKTNEQTHNLLNSIFTSVNKHLELIFHRYIKGDRRKINISVNGKPLSAFDPFHSDCHATQICEEEYIVYNNQKIMVQPYILPHHSKISKADYDKYAGQGGYVNNQGFYIYRNGRLLIYGTWFKILPRKELSKLARIQIDIPNNLDQNWKIDVKKSQASPPTVIRERLKSIVERVTNGSQRVYKGRSNKVSAIDHPLWNIYRARGEVDFSINDEHPIINNFIGGLNKRQSREFNNILQMVEKFIPLDALMTEYNQNPNDFDNAITNEEIEKYVNDSLIKLVKSFDMETLIAIFKTSEPMNKYTGSWEEFLRKYYD